MQRMATFAIEENTRTRLSFTCRPWFTAGKRVEIRKKMLISAKIGKQNGDTRTRKTEPGYLNLSNINNLTVEVLSSKYK